MPITPLYNPRNAHPAYCLRYAWSGWTTSGNVDPVALDAACGQAASGWESDGLRLLEATASDNLVQLAFSTAVNVDPVTLAARAKGRLRHALAPIHHPCTFSRKVSVRSLGENTTATVERYISEQVGRAAYVDSRWALFLEGLLFTDAAVDLAMPTATRSSRYWYNLHLVLVVSDRHPVHDRRTLLRIRDAARRVAEKKDYGIAAMAVMPDHLHCALRGNLWDSPEMIALAFQNNIAYALGQKPIWQPGYYVGTFTEYDMDAIRKRVQLSRASRSI